MKRPIAIYLVAVWCFMGLTLHADWLGKLIASYSGAREFLSSPGASVATFLEILIIWHAVQLVQLKSFNRWFAAGFFAVWTVSLYINSFLILYHRSKAARAVIVLMIFAALNIVSLWYLCRNSFREFAVRFVEERQRAKNSETMQKVSQKAVLKDLGR